MFNGLSLDQAPPVSVIMRFFASVPLFGVLLSLLMMAAPVSLLTPSHPVSLGAIHLMFLGVVTMSMIGALFQMQSVLGGRPIPSPAGNAFVIHLFLSGGILALVSAFLLAIPAMFVIGSVLLGSAIVYAAFLILPLLFGGNTHDTLRGMRLSLGSLMVTALLGIVMASAYANASFPASHDPIRTLHYSFGLIGWVSVLIIAVAFQVIEMFYVTTAYSSWCKRNVFRIILTSLILKTVWLTLGLPYGWGFDLVIAGLLGGFVVTTLKRLQERKRRVSDVSIWFWNTGMAFLGTSIAFYIATLYGGSPFSLSVSLIAFGLFALAVILGMMGKIVPFLVWFHLNAAGYLQTPIMSDIIPSVRSKALFFLFAGSSVLSLSAAAEPALLRWAGAGFFALFLLLGYNLANALSLYRRIRATGERFEFSPPSDSARS